MPQKGEGYAIDIEKTTCNNGASVEFNTDDWSIKVLNMTTSRTKCTLYFKKETIEDVILANADPTEIAYDETADNNLRYIGANPNNYISFNNELWRIIGAFNNIDDGTGKKETRLKIIRDEPYNESIAWDSSGQNNWTQASLQKELNGTYLNTIQSSYKDMIGDAKWNIGGHSTNSATTLEFYTAERSTVVYNNNPYTWIGKIGLMYPSDYGYATSGGSKADRNVCLNEDIYNWYNSDLNDCSNNNWLYKEDADQWTLTPQTSFNRVFFIDNDKRVFDTTPDMISEDMVFGLSASPVIYLSSSVKISGGTGSSSDPFKLSL